MPKNKGAGGKKFKSAKKNYGLESKNTTLKEVDQHYAKVTDVCGGSRFRVHLDNNEKLLGILCGTMKKRKIWVNKDDLVLVSIRDYEKDKVDIIGKYEHYEWEYLKNNETCLDTLIKDEEDATDFMNNLEMVDVGNISDSDSEKDSSDIEDI